MCSAGTMLIQQASSGSPIPFSSAAIDNLWHAGQQSSIAGVSEGNWETDSLPVH